MPRNAKLKDSLERVERVVAAAATLWYLPIGTIYALMQFAGLLWLRRTA